MKTAFRSWRINQLSFWGNVGVALITIGLSWYRSTATDFFSLWAMPIAAFVGAAAIGVGIYFGWAIKGLWYNKDDAGTLKDQDFDYFKWTDREDDEAIFLAQLGETAVEFWAHKMTCLTDLWDFRKFLSKAKLQKQLTAKSGWMLSLRWSCWDKQQFHVSTCLTQVRAVDGLCSIHSVVIVNSLVFQIIFSLYSLFNLYLSHPVDLN